MNNNEIMENKTKNKTVERKTITKNEQQQNQWNNQRIISANNK